MKNLLFAGHSALYRRIATIGSLLIILLGMLWGIAYSISLPDEREYDEDGKWELLSDEQSFSAFLPTIFSEGSLAGAAPKISSFYSPDEAIYPNTAVSLYWLINNPTTEIAITPSVEIMSDKNGGTVTLSETTTFELTAKNQFGTDTAVLTIEVLDTIVPPTGQSFAASPVSVVAGEPVTLTWQFEGEIDSISITPDIGDVTNVENVVVNPTVDTTYTITAVNQGGSTSSQTAVSIIPPPVIDSFEVETPTELYIGDNITFTWSIAQPLTSLTISPEVGDVLGQTEAVASVSGDQTYTLTAVNQAGTATAQVSVETIPSPTITSFTITEDWIVTGDSTTLEWGVSGQNVTVSISPDIGDVTGLTEYTVTPEDDETYTLTAQNGSGAVTAQITVLVANGDSEIIVFDWDREVTQAQRGFPNNTPPRENYDYTGTPNYAKGTLYFRAEVRSQPVPQNNMKIQLCYWQELDGDNFGLEACGGLKIVAGTPGNVVCWSQPINSMWKKDGVPIDWTRPRYRIGLAIKNGAGDPVSNYNGWNWNGENPEDWYPLDLKFTAILVAQGEPFSGFHDCSIE